MKPLTTFCILLSIFITTKLHAQVKPVRETSHKALITAVDHYLEKQAKNDSLHGVILIAYEDEILLKKAYGFKDLDHTQEHEIEGNIALASMPKMFTALSIMQLAAQEKIDISLPIGRYLKHLENPIWKNRISVKDLLAHTSGLGFYWDYPASEKISDMNTLYQTIKKIDKAPINQGVFSYSNNGYIVLGKIIEEVSGLTYKEYINKHIITPLGMKDTQLGFPDGNYYTSTLDDLFQFSQALRYHQLIDQEVFKNMIRKQSDQDYGLGFKLSFIEHHFIYGHTGGFSSDDLGLGIASSLDIIDHQYTVILLTNRNPDMGGRDARRFILHQLTKGK